MRRSLPVYSLYTTFTVLFLVLVTAQEASAQLRSFRRSQSCLLRCVASCLKGRSGGDEELKTCGTRCEPYGSPDLCSSDNDTCWRSCRDLQLPEPNDKNRNTLAAVENVTYAYDENYKLSIMWNPVPHADIYVVNYWPAGGMLQHSQAITTAPYLRNFTATTDTCLEVEIQITPVSISRNMVDSSELIPIPPPRPRVNPRMQLLSMEFINKPFIQDIYESNATVRITFRYGETKWPRGWKDLEVIPIFHMVNCAVTNLSQIVPSPNFVQGPEERTIQADVGADLMYRRCRFVYAIQEIRSIHCDSSEHLHAETNSFDTLDINCTTVNGSVCAKNPYYPAPLCGFIEDFEYSIVNKDDIDWDDPNQNISVDITFSPFEKPPLKTQRPLYYIAAYGSARPYTREDEQALLGVNLTSIIGKATNCAKLLPNNTCAKVSTDPIRLINLHKNNLYGVMICGVRDPRNTSIPLQLEEKRANKFKVEKIFIDSQEFLPDRTGLIVAIIFAVLLLALIIGAALFVAYHRYQRKRRLTDKIEIERIKKEMEQQRYVDMPKKNDIWELERRKLIIHNDRKLGSGAFGAVYLGKLIGRAEGPLEAQSTLGVNLMRAENCEVAVKMLPEYADDLSKSEFLREIGLMKTLGYHERLVNMLACITDSEPYCLIVEYCSDGDLLNFLRERCSYMLKLDEQNVDYSNPECTVEFDPDMIMTVKQLLSYSVQVSFGLEYLSQKGFVHRDVAARNILVHDRNYIKIGDFGLCRYIYAESANYKGKGGRLPVKWMSPEAIRHYEFTNKSDVWSFGVLMFEIITLGGTPYPGVAPDDMLRLLESGMRIPKPDNCPEDFYEVMKSCWSTDPSARPDFSTVRQKLAHQLEEITDEYSYLKLDARKDYYNVNYKEHQQSMTIEDHNIRAIPDARLFPDPFKKQELEHHDSGVSIELDSDQISYNRRGSPARKSSPEAMVEIPLDRQSLAGIPNTNFGDDATKI